MSDPALLVLSFAVLAAGLGGCALLHRFGLSTTHVRDVLHVGTGVWVLAWPMFEGSVAPLAVVTLAAAATLSVPWLARISPAARRVHDTFAAGDERWSGVSLYTVAYALFTWAGVRGDPFPAAAALLSLSLGDGIGGFVGRRYGKRYFRAPGGKRKSFEGSLAVALAAALGVWLAGWRFGAEVPLLLALGLGMAAALAEAVAPRGTDNFVVPATVWALAEVAR
jgi:dolichol kinase